jgi:hypothetical protein
VSFAALQAMLDNNNDDSSGVLQLSNVLLCGAQQDINIQLENNNGRFLNPAVHSAAFFYIRPESFSIASNAG